MALNETNKKGNTMSDKTVKTTPETTEAPETPVETASEKPRFDRKKIVRYAAISTAVVGATALVLLRKKSSNDETAGEVIHLESAEVTTPNDNGNPA